MKTLFFLLLLVVVGFGFQNTASGASLEIEQNIEPRSAELSAINIVLNLKNREFSLAASINNVSIGSFFNSNMSEGFVDFDNLNENDYFLVNIPLKFSLLAIKVKVNMKLYSHVLE